MPPAPKPKCCSYTGSINRIVALADCSRASRERWKERLSGRGLVIYMAGDMNEDIGLLIGQYLQRYLNVACTCESGGFWIWKCSWRNMNLHWWNNAGNWKEVCLMPHIKKRVVYKLRSSWWKKVARHQGDPLKNLSDHDWLLENMKSIRRWWRKELICIMPDAGNAVSALSNYFWHRQ